MAEPAPLSYEGVAAVAPVSVPYERYSSKSAHWWLLKALRGLTEAARIRPDQIDGLAVSSFSLHPDTAVGFAQHAGLELRWLEQIPSGGASGPMALTRAARAVQAGDAGIVACIAGDTNHIHSFRRMTAGFSRFSLDAAYPYGAGGPNAYFALLTAHYMRRFGATREDFGHIAVCQRQNALSYPFALMKSPLSLEQYLGARAIAEPLALFDCVMPCSGGEGFLVMREDVADGLDLGGARILAAIERHNAFADDPIQFRGGWARDRESFWHRAGVSPEDIDFLQTYDDYPVISMMQIEDLGFCRKGEAAEFVRCRDLTNSGQFPHNTTGGQLSTGQAGAAGGYLGLVDAIRQLTGASLGRQVPEARTAVVSGFGIVNFDRGVCASAVALSGCGG
ncbi:MAG: thiolase family protein [Albidovulum sp.]|nr:thiolase family protein [Albidovulum sp.]